MMQGISGDEVILRRPCSTSAVVRVATRTIAREEGFSGRVTESIAVRI